MLWGDTTIILGPWNKNEMLLSVCCYAVLSHSVVSNFLWSYGLQPFRLHCLWRFSRQEYWSGLPCPPPGDLPNPGMEPRYLALQVDSLWAEPPGKPKNPAVGSLAPFQVNFPTQELNRGLLHCRRMLYQLSYQGILLSSMPICKPVSGK